MVYQIRRFRTSKNTMNRLRAYFLWLAAGIFHFVLYCGIFNTQYRVFGVNFTESVG